MSNQPTIKMKLLGDKELARAMEKIENKVGKKVIRKEVREGAKLVQREAKSRVPLLSTEVGSTTQMPKKGTLRKGITVRTGKRKKGHYRVNAVMKGRDKMDLNIVKTKKGVEYYAPAVIEHGTKNGNIDGFHFLEGAFKAKHRQADEQIKKGIRNGLIREWRASMRAGSR